MATQLLPETALMIYRRLRLRNPIVAATIVAHDADVNGTPQVRVGVAEQAAPAIFAPPADVTVGGVVWFTRTAPPNRGGTGVVLWTAYQADGFGTGGLFFNGGLVADEGETLRVGVA
jgi:hypothetical protein